MSEATVQLAPGAVCCGAAGCRSGEGLLTVVVNGKQRVLCPECATYFIEKETHERRSRKEVERLTEC